MTEDKDKGKAVLPVSGLFAELSAGGDLTSVQVLNSLITSGVNLPMITKIDDSVVLTVGDVLVVYAENKKYVATANVLRCLFKSFRENACSKGGWRSNQIVEGVVADLQRMAREREDVKERLVGRGNR